VVGGNAVQLLGVEWSRDSSDLVVGRKRARAQVVLEIALEHEGVGRVISGAQYNEFGRRCVQATDGKSNSLLIQSSRRS
jgi:hypothetical protein